MATRLSQPRLVIKSANVDDVPTFSTDESGPSAPLTFRRGRSCINTRPKAIYRPHTALFTAINEPIEHNDEGNAVSIEDESSTSSNFSAAAVPTVEPGQEQEQEQRGDLLVSNSARRGILKRNARDRVRDSGSSNGGARRRVRFVEDAQYEARYTDAPCTPRHPSLFAGIEDVEMVDVKREEAEAESSTSLQGSAVASSSIANPPAVVKVEPSPVSFSAPPLLQTEGSIAVQPPASGSSSPASDSPVAVAVAVLVPSIVITSATEINGDAGLNSQESFSGSTCRSTSHEVLSFEEVLSRARDVAHKSLSLVHVPHQRMLRHVRELAHHFLKITGSYRISIQALQEKEKDALRQLRSILKDMLDVTAISKLPSSDVRAMQYETARAKCMRRLGMIVDLANGSLNVPGTPLYTDNLSVPEVNMEESD